MLPAIEIKEKAKEIGFDACGIAQVAAADSEALFFDRWLKEGNHAGMAYMENHREIRLNPAGLVEGAKTVISVALNYYPEQKLPPEAPHIAYYAYGKDYHLVVKEMLSELWTALFPRPARDRIETDGKGMDRNGLFFCDPASSAGTGYDLSLENLWSFFKKAIAFCRKSYSLFRRRCRSFIANTIGR